MKLGIFGGTFNPLHIGHEEMVRAFLKEVKPDRLLLIPNHLPPHKEAKQLASEADREQMLRLAFGDEPACEIDTREFRRKGKSYTYDTVVSLKDEYPDAQMYLLVGGDSFQNFEKWYRFEDLLQMVTLTAFAREGEKDLKKTAERYQLLYGADLLLLPDTITGVSSTEIREKIADGQPVSRLLSPEIRQFLEENQLYRDLETERAEQARYGISVAGAGRLAQAHLSAKRCRHSFCVAEAAAELARRAGADEKQAKIAGRLHDLYRETDREILLQKAEKYGIVTDDLREAAQPLLHGRAGASLLAAEYGVEPAICRAVRYHTEGSPRMDLLSRILFVADCISADRTYPDVEVTRSLAKRNLNSAVAYIFSFMEQSLGDKMTELTRLGADAYRVYLPAEYR